MTNYKFLISNKIVNNKYQKVEVGHLPARRFTLAGGSFDILSPNRGLGF